MKTKIDIRNLSRAILPVLIAAISLSSCSKDEAMDDESVETGNEAPADGTRDELTKDSIFLYAKQVYLWNDALPSYEAFNPRKYNQSSDPLDNYYSELFAITQFKVNPATGKPYEYVSASANYPKYSYITDEESNNPPTTATGSVPVVSEVTLEGVGTDFGIALSAVGSQTSYQIYIRYVSPGSPAAKNSLNRGDILTQINDHKLGANFATDQDVVNRAFDQATLRLTGKKSSGEAFTRSLTKQTYNSSPVYKDTVFTSGGKKIGYLAFARFANPSNALGPLNTVFNKLTAVGVQDLVIDLRYNGGGYVSTAEHLANLIAPSSLSGQVMFTEYYNQTMQKGEATILKNQPLLDANGKSQFQNGRLITYNDIDYSVGENTYKFQKEGSLNSVKNVVFIVTGNTASASELLINVLRPYLNVKIVGSTSYGKPVGFFPINIDKYDVYYSMFESRNSKSEGGYYQGFVPDAASADDVTRDFGDPQEASLAAAVRYLTTGTLTASIQATTKVMGKNVTLSSSTVKEVSKEDSFKGMIELPSRLKLK
ncbi:S41 family peptidase [Desertivirga arenae]|uniref:S41 family peptidase n=1 Tax=Desertivirga arenae TaxID=2810309 RepID=UPI001A97111E|nr:S41 family peptidase [Pedobacter sp. SYSU D00823]